MLLEMKDSAIRLRPMHHSTSRRLIVRAVVLLLPLIILGCSSSRTIDKSKSLTPPEPAREFRAAWVATVANIDWPSKPGLSTEQQQKEIIAILDKSKEIGLNAIVLQVRTSCDAFYPSKLEPWSEYLTGTQGQAPEPYYDPLKMWIDEAHKRGLELHAWYNPYRARSAAAKGPDAPTHASQTNPQIVKSFNGYEWLDPGEAGAADLTYNVFMDVVKRYDLDGVHIDDYFYPYKEYLTDPKTKVISDFPDEPSYQRYVQSGGKLERADWRRDNVNRLVERVYEGIKKEKPHVKFGISPFGTAHPKTPVTSQSTFDQYNSLYADTEKWLHNGWLDYWTPQLYWKVGSAQPYEDLVSWWSNENLHGRHLWPGLIPSSVGNGTWESSDILNQIYVTRATPDATGHVHFSMKALMGDFGKPDSGTNRSRGRRSRRGADSAPASQPATKPTTNPTTQPTRIGIATALENIAYHNPALVPATPWLDKKAPGSPSFQVHRGGSLGGANVYWKPRGREKPWLWVVYTRHKAAWKMHVVSADKTSIHLENDLILGPVTAVAVRAVDRSGNLSAAVKAKEVPNK
jgi:uncharacterized lipoprotein YddW (UPF0748 family)